jgi:hypothetical protein
MGRMKGKLKLQSNRKTLSLALTMKLAIGNAKQQKEHKMKATTSLGR